MGSRTAERWFEILAELSSPNPRKVGPPGMDAPRKPYANTSNISRLESVTKQYQTKHLRVKHKNVWTGNYYWRSSQHFQYHHFFRLREDRTALVGILLRLLIDGKVGFTNPLLGKRIKSLIIFVKNINHLVGESSGGRKRIIWSKKWFTCHEDESPRWKRWICGWRYVESTYPLAEAHQDRLIEI